MSHKYDLDTKTIYEIIDRYQQVTSRLLEERRYPDLCNNAANLLDVIKNASFTDNKCVMLANLGLITLLQVLSKEPPENPNPYLIRCAHEQSLIYLSTIEQKLSNHL